MEEKNNDRKGTLFWLAILCGQPSIHLPRDIPAILAKKHEGLSTIVMPAILLVYVFIKIYIQYLDYESEVYI